MTCRTVLTALLCAAVSACGGAGDDDNAAMGDSTQAQAQPAAAPASGVASTYAPELNVDLGRMTRSETGLYTQDLQEGAGDPVQSGRTVAVHYTGWLPDGTKFDSSRDRGAPIEFVLGTNKVIVGWDQGLAGMRKGGRRLLVIPPDLAYGEEGRRGVIPPRATLVFDVELVEIR
jgi:FKBP-type peptidyl-prolyl cis-trans isomerase FkpA